MGKIFKAIKNFFAWSDLFSSTYYIQYNEEHTYNTVTGGIISIVIGIIVIYFLIQMSVATFALSNITASISAVATPPASNFTVAFDPSSKFTFAVKVANFDLNNDPERFFNIDLYESTKSNYKGTVVKRKIQLVPCSSDMWNLNADLTSAFNSRQLNKSLCPSASQNFTLAGSSTTTIAPSTISLVLEVNDCSNASLDPRPCAFQQSIYSMIQTTYTPVSIFYINSLVSPSDQNYLTYHIYHNIHYGISPNLSSIFLTTLQQSTVLTDTSLMPWSNIQEDDVYQISQIAHTFIQNRTSSSPSYMSVVLTQSPQQVTYSRAFQKVSDVISYVGGLLGGLFLALVFLKHFNRITFELTLGRKIFFSDKPELKEKFKKFNICLYLGYMGYRLVRMLGCKCENGTFETYNQCRTEINKQLDVKFMLDRFIFYERTFQCLVDEQQYLGMHLQEPITVEETAKLQQYYYLRAYLKEKYKVKRKELKKSKKISQLRSMQKSGDSGAQRQESQKKQESQMKQDIEKRSELIKYQSSPEITDKRMVPFPREGDEKGQNPSLMSPMKITESIMRYSRKSFKKDSKILPFEYLDEQFKGEEYLLILKQEAEYSQNKLSRLIYDKLDPEIHKKLRRSCRKPLEGANSMDQELMSNNLDFDRESDDD